MDEQAIKKILKQYWAEIVTYGVPAFFEKHPEFLIIYASRGLIDELAHMAYKMLSIQLRNTKHLSEWLLTIEAPAAKGMIEFMFQVGIHDSAFQNWFIESHYPGDIEEAARKINPAITAAEFMKIFKEEMPKIILK